MTTSPLFVETAPPSRPIQMGNEEQPDRIHRLEEEVAELRETIARFAELVIGEVKDLRQSHSELPVFPPAIAGELPITHTSKGNPTLPLEPTSSRPWLLMELLRDFGATFRMYLDPRYRVRRATQMMVPLILALFAFNCYFFNLVFSLPFLSSGLEKVFDLVLAFLLYKVIHREIVRYRQVLAQLMAWHEYRHRSTARYVSSEPTMTVLETE